MENSTYLREGPITTTKLAVCPLNIHNLKFNWSIVFRQTEYKSENLFIIISLIQHFEDDFLWKASLKILKSGIILKTFTHGVALSLPTASMITLSVIWP